MWKKRNEKQNQRKRRKIEKMWRKRNEKRNQRIG
jgi:hypothetical protein